MISREEAVKLLEQKQKHLMTMYQRYLEDGGEPLQEHENWLYALNMAVEKYKQPERPKGRWVGEVIHTEIGEEHAMQECSHCSKVRIIDNFCPNCGSDNRGEEE